MGGVAQCRCDRRRRSLPHGEINPSMQFILSGISSGRGATLDRLDKALYTLGNMILISYIIINIRSGKFQGGYG
jgi:hypothetical protein